MQFYQLIVIMSNGKLVFKRGQLAEVVLYTVDGDNSILRSTHTQRTITKVNNVCPSQNVINIFTTHPLSPRTTLKYINEQNIRHWSYKYHHYLLKSLFTVAAVEYLSVSSHWDPVSAE